jgi:ubiquinone/menaquinone biosynthesis C-methylase UbiE
MAAQHAFENDWENADAQTRNEPFSNTEKKFRDLGTTDTEPVSVIVSKLNDITRVAAVDVGCGIGRYDMLLYRYLGDRLALTCLDAEEDTVNNLATYLARHGIRSFSVKKSAAGTMPFSDDSMDCMVTFNAVRHHDLPHFVSEGARIIRTGGYLFVYTKLHEQNELNVWRQHLPRFDEKEKRLSTLDAFKQSIDTFSNLAIESIVFFAYTRMAALEQSFHRARSHYDAALPRYTPEELEEALKAFSVNVRDQSKETQSVRWFDENVLFVIKKEQKTSVDYLKIASSFQNPGIVA